MIVACVYSHSMLIGCDVMTFSDELSLTAWQVTTTNWWPFGMTTDTLEIVIQLDCGPATAVDVLFFSGSPATIHFIVEGGLLRSVLQLRFITSPGLASVGPLISTWLEPSARVYTLKLNKLHSNNVFSFRQHCQRATKAIFGVVEHYIELCYSADSAYLYTTIRTALYRRNELIIYYSRNRVQFSS